MMECERRRADVLQVAEHAASSEQRVDLSIQAPLALICYVMDGETRHDCIECSERSGQRFVEVVNNDADGRIATEPAAKSFDHRRRKIKCDRCRLRVSQFHKSQQATVAAAEIQNS